MMDLCQKCHIGPIQYTAMMDLWQKRHIGPIQYTGYDGRMSEAKEQMSDANLQIALILARLSSSHGFKLPI